MVTQEIQAPEVPQRINLSDKFHNVLSVLTDYANLAQQCAVPTAKEEFLAGLEINETLHQIYLSIDLVRAKVAERFTAEREVVRLRKEIEEIKALHIVNGDIVARLGKERSNETERDAAMRDILRSDPEYQATQENLAHWESTTQELEADLEQLRARSAALRYEARLKAAQLEYLAE